MDSKITFYVFIVFENRFGKLFHAFLQNLHPNMFAYYKFMETELFVFNEKFSIF